MEKYEKVAMAYHTMKEQEACWPHEKRALVAQLEALSKDQPLVLELEEDNEELVQLNNDKQRQIEALTVERDSLKETLTRKEEELQAAKAAAPEQADRAQPK